MEFIFDNNINNSLSSLIASYENENMNILEQKIQEVFFLPIYNIDVIIKCKDKYYNKDSDIYDIESVMKNSLHIIEAKQDYDKNTIKNFNNDLNFSKVTALEFFHENANNMDLFAFYKNDITAFENLCHDFSNHIKNHKNLISFKALLSVKNLLESLQYLSGLITLRMHEMSIIQSDTLEIINNIKIIEERLKQDYL